MYRERLKLLHACVFFAENCADVGRMKLYKLLFALDFDQYRKMGRSVTGLTYEAWEMGPVPASFDREWRNGLKPDLAVGLTSQTVTKRDFENEDDEGYEMHKLTPRIAFDEGLFSRNEFEMMRNLARTCFNTTATKMSKQTHAAFGYWDEIWNARGEHRGQIPYGLVYDRQNNERDKLMREFAEEKELLSAISD